MKLFKSLGLLGSHDMWNTTVVQTLLIMISSPVVAAVLWKTVPSISYTYIVTFLLGLIPVVILWLNRKTKPLNWASGIYLYNVLICAIGVSFNQEFWLKSSLPFQAFFGYKFIAFIITLQTPSNRTVGRSAMAFLFTAPLFQYFAWSQMDRATIGVQEPWLTLLAVGCAAVLYEQSLHFHQILQKKTRLETAAQEMRRYAHLLLGAQHLINTPLQIIEGTSELIRHKHPDAGLLVDRIDKAFAPIKEVNRLLSFGRNHVDWVEIQLPSTVADLEKEICLLIPDMDSEAAEEKPPA